MVETIWNQKIWDYRLKCPLTLLAAYSAVFRKLIWESFYTRAQEKNAHKIERKRKNNIYSAAVHAGWPLCHAAECTVCLELWSTYLQWKSLFISKGLKTLGKKYSFWCKLLIFLKYLAKQKQNSSSVKGGVDTVQDFLIKLGIKPRIHLWEISILSLNSVNVRPTKIMNRADEN